jgi:hypothetical protein
MFKLAKVNNANFRVPATVPKEDKTVHGPGRIPTEIRELGWYPVPSSLPDLDHLQKSIFPIIPITVPAILIN